MVHYAYRLFDVVCHFFHEATAMLAVRVVLALGALGMLCWRIASMRVLLREIRSTTSVVSIPYNDAIQSGIQVVIDQSTSWAQFTILILGGLAALWISKGEEPQLALRLRLWPEIAMWVGGVGMLVIGLYCHKEYLDSIGGALQAGGAILPGTSIPDVFAPHYEGLRTEQFWLLVSGTLTSILAVFSVRHFTGGNSANR